MSRWIGFSLLIAFVLVAVGLLFSLLEPVEEVIRTRPEAAVLSNPLYAARELFRSLEMPSRQRRGVRHLPPPDHALVFYSEAGSGLTPREAGELLAWAWDYRGHLITGPDRALLDALGAELVETGESGFEVLRMSTGEGSTHQVSMPREHTLERLVSEPWLTVGMPEDSTAQGDVLLRYRRSEEDGGGVVTVLSDLSFLSNERIGQQDHAAFLWELVRVLPAEGVWLVREGTRPSLLAVVARRGWMVLLSLAALLLAGWLRGARPFGPPEADPAPARRSLREHLQATGRYLWRQNWGSTLLTSTREAALGKVAASHPGWPQMSFRQRCTLLAERTGIPAEEVARTLQPAPPAASKSGALVSADAATFQRSVEILETIRRSV